MIDLDEIRYRADNPNIAGSLSSAPSDRRALLAYVDALREAAGKVTCWECNGTEFVGDDPCPDCASLRALLSPAPSTAPDSSPATP